jgi:hypothetical protein
MAGDSQPDDAVGYCQPPRHRQFRKGRSGNPTGRPKGAVGFKAALLQELQEVVSVKDGGRTRRMTKFQVACRQLANKAAAGCVRSLKLIAQLVPDPGDAANPSGPVYVIMSEDDQRLL